MECDKCNNKAEYSLEEKPYGGRYDLCGECVIQVVDGDYNDR